MPSGSTRSIMAMARLLPSLVIMVFASVPFWAMNVSIFRFDRSFTSIFPTSLSSSTTRAFFSNIIIVFLVLPHLYLQPRLCFSRQVMPLTMLCRTGRLFHGDSLCLAFPLQQWRFLQIWICYRRLFPACAACKEGFRLGSGGGCGISVRFSESSAGWGGEYRLALSVLQG